MPNGTEGELNGAIKPIAFVNGGTRSSKRTADQSAAEKSADFACFCLFPASAPPGSLGSFFQLNPQLCVLPEGLFQGSLPYLLHWCSRRKSVNLPPRLTSAAMKTTANRDGFFSIKLGLYCLCSHGRGRRLKARTECKAVGLKALKSCQNSRCATPSVFTGALRRPPFRRSSLENWMCAHWKNNLVIIIIIIY